GVHPSLVQYLQYATKREREEEGLGVGRYEEEGDGKQGGHQHAVPCHLRRPRDAEREPIEEEEGEEGCDRRDQQCAHDEVAASEVATEPNEQRIEGKKRAGSVIAIAILSDADVVIGVPAQPWTCQIRFCPAC